MMTLRIESNIQSHDPEAVEPAGVSTSARGAGAATEAGLHHYGVATLPEPLRSFASGGDLLTELTVLLTLASRSDRDAARKAERAEDMLRTQQEHSKVRQMHEQAADIRAQGWAQGLADIGQGVCQIGAGTITARPGKLDWNDASLALNKGFAAAGGAVSGQYKAMEKLAQAAAEEAGANADRAGRGSKQASEDVENARDTLKKIASFYEQMLQAQSASLNAAANFRA
jgi:hypothetical protein